MLSKQEAKTNHRAHSMVTLSSPRRLLLRPLFLRRLPLHLLLRWLFLNEDIGSYRTIRGFWVEVFWRYSAHAQWYASYSLAPHRQYVNERTERRQTVMQILKAARIAASDIVDVSAATSGRLSTSRLLCSEAIPAVSSNGDIIHLSPETLGWDWRAHFGRPR